MMVFFSHYPIPGATGTLLHITQAGYAGVTFFFVLSGFVITYNYLESFARNATLKITGDYLIARFARIYPLYLFLIVFVWLPMPSGAVNIWPYVFAIQTWSPSVWVAYGLVGPSWSIGVEIFLYLAFPLLVPLVSRLGILDSRRRLCGAVIVVSAALFCAAAYFAASGRNGLSWEDASSGHRWLYRTPATRLGDFLLGMFGAVYCMRMADKSPGTIRRWGIATVLAALVSVLFMAMKANIYSAYSWDIAYAIPAAVLFVGMTINDRTLICRTLGLAPMVLLGEASYALYLFHTLAAPLWHPVATGTIVNLALYSIFTALVIAMSVGIHVALERPARRIIRMLVR
jgi:peptidoglycan/LPS O-acetylase OafA/YrhL